MHELRPQFEKDLTLKEMLEVVKMPKATYFDELRRIEKDKAKDLELIGKIKEISEKSRGTYGSPRITSELHRTGMKVGHNKVARLMRQNGLNVKRRHAKYKSYKGEFGKTFGNLLLEERAIPGTNRKTSNRNFKASAPYRKCTTDVTEFKTREGKLYLAPVMDLYNQEIIAYTLSPSPNMQQQYDMLDQAFESIGDDGLKGMIFHSVQGWQYQHKEFQRRLREKGVRQSMSRKGNCHDNSVMENFFGRLKNDCYYGHEYEFETRDSLISVVQDYITFYNCERIQLGLGGMSPVGYRQSTKG